jgi:hypothetical protein
LLINLLKELDVPVSSQMLVYSATSLQRPDQSTKSARALFNDTYVGYVPGGRIEVVSVDPHPAASSTSSTPCSGKGLGSAIGSRMTCHAPIT